MLDLDADAAEQLPRLADRMHLHVVAGEDLQVTRTRRRNREVAPILRPRIRTLVANERPCDNAGNVVRRHEELARDRAPGAQLVQRNDVRVRRDLKEIDSRVRDEGACGDPEELEALNRRRDRLKQSEEELLTAITNDMPARARAIVNRAIERRTLNSEMKSVRNTLSRLRVKLHAFGIGIRSIHAEGYMLTALRYSPQNEAS